MIPDPQSLIGVGVLTFLGLSQASTIPTSSDSSTAQPTTSTQAVPPPVPLLFGVNGPVLTDVIADQSCSPDDSQAWYPATAGILANINSSGIQGLFDQLSTTGSITTVKLHLLDGGVRNYSVNYNEAIVNGSHVMGNERAGWPAALRSAIIQHHAPGVESYRLGQGLAKDCMKILTGLDYRADQVEEVDLWSIWNDYGPDKHSYVFRTVELGNTKLAPEHDYGVVQVFKENKTVDLYDPNPEVGRRVYQWDEIVKDLDIVSWPVDLNQQGD
ncbi:hypothetical protein I302_106845 [Kwoniella bestiolae CBS 10118]|uniref:Calpain catalytic domain-containing protein n=1 Tax=Kwoniella bestiolae CBS 10118 TaxID=1296100 RepID=A0A1B9G087_9TREE|nr:hypothetical protein I302_05890 [Kwoniella bestiolae CBS 10118]OCF24430.1 hypothetical protein I302_05890 [Kwoniella bestiolae CBS 10118]